MKMKDKSIIKNLYREEIPGAEEVIINDEDYKVHREKKNRLEETLRRTFSTYIIGEADAFSIFCQKRGKAGEANGK